MGLIDRDRHLRYAMEQASTTIRTTRDVEGLRQMRARLDTLERERHALMARESDRSGPPSPLRDGAGLLDGPDDPGRRGSASHARPARRAGAGAPHVDGDPPRAGDDRRSAAGSTRTARLAVEELEQRAVRLRELIRHAEQQLMMRQRTIAELEGQVLRLLDELPRIRTLHAEAETRMATLRHELAELDGS